jgi:endonuclease G, mitochondrial
MTRLRRVILPLLLAFLVLTQQSATQASNRLLAAWSPATPATVKIVLGNPSDATSDPSNKKNYLLVKPQFILSYNNDTGGPNWVSWHLQKSDIGKIDRLDNFHPEAGLPQGFTRVTPTDYAGSGYDRGHMCNSKDRTNTAANNSETFSMANMLPQTPDLNRHVWEKLEVYCRTLAMGGSEMYIFAGGYGSKETIGHTHHVNVPTRCWKIVVILPMGDNDLRRIDANTRVIAVDMPNDSGIAKNRWQQYITTVADIEQKTGYKFFTTLSDDVRNALRAKTDSGRSMPARP